MSEKTPGYNPEESSEITEIEAAELLQTEQEFSAEERERLVSLVTDPNLSMYILGLDDAHGKKLTRSQAEKLLNQALNDPEVVDIFYTTLTESGVELNENETGWFERIKEVRDRERNL